MKVEKPKSLAVTARRFPAAAVCILNFCSDRRYVTSVTSSDFRLWQTERQLSWEAQLLRSVLISLSAGLAGVAMFGGPGFTIEATTPEQQNIAEGHPTVTAKQAGEQELEATLYVIQNLVPPEVVQLENVQVEGDMKTIYVGNANKHYLLFCNIKADGCITPEENKNYLLFDSNTRWEMPGAKDFLTLKFMQHWTVTYNQGKNIGLIAEDPSTPSTGLGIGMFILDETGGGYEQGTVSSDGPIIYGTGMNDRDRRAPYQKVKRPR